MNADRDAAKLHDGDRDPSWPEGFYWSEEYERPVFLAQRDDSSASVDGRANPLSPSLRAVGVPHLDRACEILWEVYRRWFKETRDAD